MYLIAGLGNPGREYEMTRHNAGFRVVDRLAGKMGCEVGTRKFLGFTGSGILGGEKVLLLKPQTYMNNSGESVRAAADFYKLAAEQVIVVYDDISLDVGGVRVRAQGSAGGHNGMKSIIAHLGTDKYPRVRVGIGDKPPRMDLADYVLSRFTKAEEEEIEKAAADAADAVELLIAAGVQAAMNRYNKVKRPREPESGQRAAAGGGDGGRARGEGAAVSQGEAGREGRAENLRA